jgi:hypothetical protein
MEEQLGLKFGCLSLVGYELKYKIETKTFYTLTPGTKCEGLILYDDNLEHLLYTDSSRPSVVMVRAGSVVKRITDVTNPRGCCRLKGPRTGGFAVADTGSKRTVILDEELQTISSYCDPNTLPTSVCSTSGGNLLDFDKYNNTMRLFDVRIFTKPTIEIKLVSGMAGYNFGTISHLTCHPTKDVLYFTDPENHVVVIYDMRFPMVHSVVNPHFQGITSCAVNATDQIYFCHEKQNMVSMVGPNTVLNKTWAIPSKRLGMIDINTHGQVGVVDMDANRVVFLN